MLSVLDRKWREHLYEMDYLKEGIGLRAMAQRDPLVEYQREGYDMFAAMLDSLKEESVGFLYNLQVQVVSGDQAAAQAGAQPAAAVGAGNGGAASGAAPESAGPAAGTGPAGGAGTAGTAAPTGPEAPSPADRGAPVAAGRRDRGERDPVGRQRARRAAGEGTGRAERGVVGLADLHRAPRGRRHGDHRRHRQPAAGRGDRHEVEAAGPQRAVPVRVRQEVQGLPRPARSRAAVGDLPRGVTASAACLGSAPAYRR